MDFRKRPGEFISRHELNKKKRIGLDHVSDRIKTEAVNGLPDETKIDLFNAFVRSAFPDFDNLLMASWNVVSIYVNVGSENEMLHNSVGDLHEVLMKFDELLGKSKKPRPGANGHAGKFTRSWIVSMRCYGMVYGSSSHRCSILLW